MSIKLELSRERRPIQYTGVCSYCRSRYSASEEDLSFVEEIIPLKTSCSECSCTKNTVEWEVGNYNDTAILYPWG